MKKLIIGITLLSSISAFAGGETKEAKSLDLSIQNVEKTQTMEELTVLLETSCENQVAKLDSSEDVSSGEVQLLQDDCQEKVDEISQQDLEEAKDAIIDGLVELKDSISEKASKAHRISQYLSSFTQIQIFCIFGEYSYEVGYCSNDTEGTLKTRLTHVAILPVGFVLDIVTLPFKVSKIAEEEF